ncbi:hypothetical protein [Flavobacterium sp.]|uniref:hypothetical protein n=1 Tax=Flavobacterium sp. TaxID=239 RepID=UPI0022C54385|nr:hypothetical protein [Flavobacterium sp.]MCZ8227900.1 hypothetical protein [Flavobacterium sp.]
MDIRADINWIHQEIDKVNDLNFIEKIKRLLETINTSKEATAAEYNADIDAALKSINDGAYYTQDEAKNLSKKWGRK